MKKKIAKISILVCTIALALTVIFALSACNGGKKYTYSDIRVKVTTNGATSSDTSAMETSLKNTYGVMYKDSTITVSDSKIVWEIAGTESSMDVKKDGDKYVLSGDYVDQMKKALSTGMSVGGASTSVDFQMYGIEADGGFNLVMDISAKITVTGVGNTTTKETITFIFVK